MIQMMVEGLERTLWRPWVVFLVIVGGLISNQVVLIYNTAQVERAAKRVDVATAERAMILQRIAELRERLELHLSRDPQ